jgi:hypothetical protein
MAARLSRQFGFFSFAVLQSWLTHLVDRGAIAANRHFVIAANSKGLGAKPENN